MNQLLESIAQNHWVTLIVLLFGATIIARLIIWPINRFIRTWREKSNLAMPKGYLFKFNTACFMIVFSAVLYSFGPQFLSKFSYLALLKQGSYVVLTMSLVWAVYSLVDLVGQDFVKRAEQTGGKIDDIFVPLIFRSLKILLFIFALVWIAHSFSINVAGVLAGLGIGGLAFAFAAKDILANIFGSLTVLFDRPFRVGDFVKIQNITGTVEEVGFRSTRIRTSEDSLVSLPNSILTNSPIDNFGSRRYRRIKFFAALTYGTSTKSINQFCEGVREIILNHPTTRKDSFDVAFNEMGDFSLNILINYYLQVQNWSAEVKERDMILSKIYDLAESLGVEFAFPTQTLELKQNEKSK